MMPSYYGSDIRPWLLLLIFHLVMAVAFWKIAEKAKEEPKWFAFIPILNIVLLLKIAKKPLWWLILFLLPIVNIVAIIAAMMAICERFGLNKWWGLVAILSPFNLVLLLYLAFDTKMMPAQAASPTFKPPGAPQA